MTTTGFNSASDRKPLATVIALIAAWAIVVAALALWLTRTPTDTLRDQLRRWQFWILEAQFLGLLATTSLCIRPLAASLALSRRVSAAAISAAALAFLLTAFAAPQTSRIFYDEQIYQSVGQNLSDLRLAQMCNEGNVEYGSLQCSRGEYNKEPYGYPYLLSVAYRFSGVREATAFALNAVSAALLVLALFVATTTITGRAEAGVYAALVAALIPEHLRWSHTASAEPTAALFCTLAVLAAAAFVRLRTDGALAWMVFATVFAVQFRTESALIVPVVAAIVLLFASNELRRPRLWWSALAALALASPHIGHLVAVRNEGWGSSGVRFSLAFAADNLKANGWFYLADPRFPVVYTILAAVGLIAWRRRRETLIPALYFLLFWGIFLFFYAGSYNYGADDRFSLMVNPPIAIVAGLGACTLFDWLKTTPVSDSARWQITTALVIVPFLWFMPFVRAAGEEAWGARADVSFARTVIGSLPRNSIVLTHNPNMFHVWGQSAAQGSIATTEPGYVSQNLMRRYAGGVYFHWNFWCNVADPLQQSFCTNLLMKFPHTLVREYRERDYRYAIYKLNEPAP